MQRIRKMFVVSVMAITVLSMSIVAVPQVQAASAGDLIKMDGLSSVYYLGADSKRYVFPNEATYFSWYADFSTVKTISQAELESYSLAKNITVRPGTKLVKITTDPKVYSVEPGGNLKWVPSEAVASALFGADWNKRIIDVPDGFFTNYTVVSGQIASDAYPAGSLIKLSSQADVYYIDTDGKARKIASEAAFNANKFNWNNVITAAAGFTLPALGDDVIGMESALSDTAQGAGGMAGAGTGLTVALSGDTAPSRNVPSSSTLVPFVTVNFTAASDGDVRVDNLVFTRRGVGLASEFDGGYLYVGDERLTTKRTVNTSDNKITFSALNLNIPAGSTKAVTLKMNLNASGTGNHYFELASASVVGTNGAVVSGAFPISGNAMAKAFVSAATITLNGAGGSYNRKIGETNVMLGEFTMQNGSATEDVNVYRIRLRQEETAGSDAIANLSLELDGTVVKEGVSMVDKYIDFILDTPFQLRKSRTITAIVRGDVLGEIGKKVQFYLQNVVDADVRGTAYGDFYSSNVTGLGAGTGPETTIQGSEVNVSFDGPQATETKDDTTDFVLANFKVMSANESVNFDTLRVRLTTNSISNKLPINWELVDATNNVSYSVSDPASTTATTYNLDFDNVYIAKGTQYNFQIRADIQDGTNVNTTYAVSINFSDGQGCVEYFQDTDQTAVADSDYSSLTLSGKTMTVKAPEITFAKVTTTAATYVKNAKQVLLFKGKIFANNVDNLRVSKVNLDGDTGFLAFVGSAFNKVYFNVVNADGSETTLDTETSLSAATAVPFSGFTLNIPKGTSNGKYIVVRGDVKDSPTAGTISFNWNTYSTSNYTVRDSDNNDVASVTADSADGHVSTIAANGTYTLAFDSTEADTNTVKNVLAGQQVLVGRLKATAQYEEVKLEDFTLINMLGDATSDHVAYLRLYGEKAMTTLLGEATLGSSREATFEDVNILIPVTNAKYIYVAAALKPIDYSSTPAADATGVANKTVKLDIASSTSMVVKAVGNNTSEVLDNTGVASTTATVLSTIMGATMSNITTAFANGSLPTGIRDIFSFKVTAPASDNRDYNSDPLGIRLGTTTFSIATTSGVQAGTFMVRRVGGANGEKAAKYDGAAVTTTNGTSFVIDFLQTYAGTDTDLTVKPGETAEYIISATLAVTNANQSLQTTIESVDSNMYYTHNYASTSTPGTLAGYATPVRPLLSGITSVRGGTLSN